MKHPKNRFEKEKKTSLFLLLVAFLLAILLFSFLFALFNDRYAFFSREEPVTLTLGGDESPKEIAKKAKEAGVITFSSLYARSLRRALKDRKIAGGVYSLRARSPYRTVTKILLRQGEADTVRLTFYEGETVAQMLRRLIAHGVGTEEGYQEAMADPALTSAYPFLPAPDETGKICLEGYLYPDTYEFYQNSKESTVLSKFLTQFSKKFDGRYQAFCKKRGYTVGQAITLASLIQAEGKGVGEYANISSVFTNRLRNWENPRLESDAGVRYALQLQGEQRGVQAQDLQLDSPYNTYLYAGLPPTPICNPGQEAMAYALCPAKTEYYYFVADGKGVAHFATTYSEHQRNIERIKKEKE